SPDVAALRRGPDHGAALLAGERLLELGEVPERAIHAQERRRVRIGQRAHPTKNCCDGVSVYCVFGACCARYVSIAACASFKPPRSAVFSPSVSAPFT